MSGIACDPGPQRLLLPRDEDRHASAGPGRPGPGFRDPAADDEQAPWNRAGPEGGLPLRDARGGRRVDDAPDRGDSRAPEFEDLVALCRSLEREGVRYILILSLIHISEPTRLGMI